VSRIANTLPPKVSSSPSSNHVWPVVPARGRPNLYVARGAAGGAGSGRAIGADRSWSGGRTHTGVDLYASGGRSGTPGRDTIVALADGEILSFYFFYRYTFALFVDHGAFVVNYGEVARDSLAIYNLKTPLYRDGDRSGKGPFISKGDRLASKFSWIGAGSIVKAGQPIAKVGRMFRSSMLHLEMYTPGNKTNLQWKGHPGGAPPSGLLDPTDFLIALAQRARVGYPPIKEKVPAEVVCR
jgi:hypothetical protein